MEFGELLNWVGFNRHKINYKEKVISTLGGFLGIFIILGLGRIFLAPDITVLIVPSMGATAVLLFAAPNSPFSQPWNVFGGHLVSAAIGVICWRLIPEYTFAAAASVGLAIGAMYLTRCLHPPGGATALAVVIGGDNIHSLGFSYITDPIFFNVVTIFIVAIVFNRFFKWRRYPAYQPAGKKGVISNPKGYDAIDHADFVYALSEMDTFIDVSEEDLLKLYALATKRHVDVTHSSQEETD